VHINSFYQHRLRVNFAAAASERFTPFITISGSNYKLDMAGRHIRLLFLGNRLTTLLNAHGNSMEHYGDLDLKKKRGKNSPKSALSINSSHK
jgi:hypothetical protein